MRIAYLVQQFVPEVGAGPARVLEMGRRWIEQGAELTVITGMPNRPQGRIYPEYRGRWFMEEWVEGIRVLRSWLYADPRPGFGRTLLNNATFMLTAGLHGLLRAGNPDVVIASEPPFLPHVSGAMVAALRGRPLVLEVRDMWPDYLVDMGALKPGGLATRGLFALERALLGRAAGTVVVTEAFRRRIIGKGVPAESVHVIPNGVDPALYYPCREPPPLQELERRNGEIIVGYLGNFGVSQGLEVVLEAARRLQETGSRVRFVLAGDGPQRNKLQATRDSAGLSNVSLHGAIAKPATRAFYNACDLCLVPLAPFPVLAETVPSKLFEILACGRPVIAGLAGEGQGIVEASGAGLAVAPGNAEELASGIAQLAAAPPDRRAAMGEAGRHFVLANYARDRLADRYLSLLHEVHSGRQR